MDGDSVEIRTRISLEMADDFVLGWKEMVMIELDRLRMQMPRADELEIRLIQRRTGRTS